MLKFVLLLSAVAVAIYGAPTAISVSDGYIDVSIDDEEVVSTANHVAKIWSQWQRSAYHYRLVKIISAEKQVVDDEYMLVVIIGKTTCKVKEVDYEDSADCDFSSYQRCVVVVWRKNPESELEVGASGCNPVSEWDFEEE